MISWLHQIFKTDIRLEEDFLRSHSDQMGFEDFSTPGLLHIKINAHAGCKNGCSYKGLGKPSQLIAY